MTQLLQMLSLASNSWTSVPDFKTMRSRQHQKLKYFLQSLELLLCKDTTHNNIIYQI